MQTLAVNPQILKFDPMSSRWNHILFFFFFFSFSFLIRGGIRFLNLVPTLLNKNNLTLIRLVFGFHVE